MEEEKGKHLTIQDRREIEKMLKKGHKINRIATRLGKTYNAIKYEVNQRSRIIKDPTTGKITKAYDAAAANHKAYIKRHQASYRGRKIVNNKDLRQFIDEGLLMFRSPESIAGRLKTGIDGLPYVSRSTIENYLNSVWGEPIRLEIAQFKKKYKRRINHNKKAALDGRTFIDERPKEITNRERVGDVELDFVVSGRGGAGCLLTIRDRKSRKGFIYMLYPVTFDKLKQLLIEFKKRFPELKSITTDNDLLLSKHNTLAEILGVPIYFCHPYSSWEKGSVENLNKFIRKFIKKGSDIHTYSIEMIKRIEHLANSLYLKVLGYLTPDEFHRRELAKELTENA